MAGKECLRLPIRENYRAWPTGACKCPSSNGRILALQARGCGFESHGVHSAAVVKPGQTHGTQNPAHRASGVQIPSAALRWRDCKRTLWRGALSPVSNRRERHPASHHHRETRAVTEYQCTQRPATPRSRERPRGANPRDGATGGGSIGDSHCPLEADSVGSIPITRTLAQGLSAFGPNRRMRSHSVVDTRPPTQSRRVFIPQTRVRIPMGVWGLCCSLDTRASSQSLGSWRPETSVRIRDPQCVAVVVELERFHLVMVEVARASRVGGLSAIVVVESSRPSKARTGVRFLHRAYELGSRRVDGSGRGREPRAVRSTRRRIGRNL